jgi:hypothetical protein
LRGPPRHAADDEEESDVPHGGKCWVRWQDACAWRREEGKGGRERGVVVVRGAQRVLLQE